MEAEEFNSTYSLPYNTYDTILVYVLLIERVITAVLFGIIIRHWICENFTQSRPRLEFNMVLLGDMVRLVMVTVQCIAFLLDVENKMVSMKAGILDRVGYHVNEASHQWREIWEVIVVVVIFSYLMFPLNRKYKTRFRTLFFIAILVEALFITIGVFHIREMSHEVADKYVLLNRFGYQTRCQKIHVHKHTHFAKFFLYFNSAITVCFVLTWMVALSIGIQAKKLKLWFDAHHLNNLLRLVAIFFLFTFPDNVLDLIASHTTLLDKKSLQCNVILLIINIISSLRCLLDLFMWHLCGKFKIGLNIKCDQNNPSEGSSLNGSAEQLLLSVPRETIDEDTSVYPNAEKYFKERVQLFTKTVILDCLMKHSDDTRRTSQTCSYNTTVLEGTDICAIECFANHFRQLRESVWRINPEDFLKSLKGLTMNEVTIGKTANICFKTQDSQYLVRNISRSEYRSLVKLLPEYCNFVSSNEESFLLRIMGLYRIKFMKFQPKINVIVMENVRYSHGSHAYDLTEFKEVDAGRYLSADDGQLMSTLRRDVQFLMHNNCIDYSVVVAAFKDASKLLSLRQYGKGKDSEFYKFCIIDFLNIPSRKLFGKRARSSKYAQPILNSIYSSEASYTTA